MKAEKCSWCGRNIKPGNGSTSNGKNYHVACLTTRNVAGKARNTEMDIEDDLPYVPVVTHTETQRATDELLTTTNFNWKEAAKASRQRILDKYGTGLRR